MKRPNLRITLRVLSAALLALCVLLAAAGWRAGIFASQEALSRAVAGAGIAGGALFVLFQAVQVVIPIVPGGLGCLAGVILFGAVRGFVYNYLGICIGSLLAFAIARNCGRPLLTALFPEKLLAKYDRWTAERGRFTRFLALAIFFPVAPDDFLCYLAGTTGMAWQHFAAIIFLGKPCSIALYSLGLTFLWQRLTAILLR